MKYLFVVLLALLCASVCWGTVSEKINRYGVLDMTEKSDFIAVGTVKLMNAYYTEDVHNGTILTDVLVKIDQLIKGKPNVGSNHVKFAIEGGEAYVAKEDKVLGLDVYPKVEFEIGESVLLFLRIADNEGYFQNWPYGRLHVHMWTYGKKAITTDNKVSFRYEHDSKAKPTVIPLDLTKVLIKSYLKDKNATKPIENEIKALVRNSTSEHYFELASKSVSSLKKKTRSILDKEVK